MRGCCASGSVLQHTAASSLATQSLRHQHFVHAANSKVLLERMLAVVIQPSLACPALLAPLRCTHLLARLGAAAAV
jgi:hypothetical protein